MQCRALRGGAVDTPCVGGEAHALQPGSVKSLAVPRPPRCTHAAASSPLALGVEHYPPLGLALGALCEVEGEGGPCVGEEAGRRGSPKCCATLSACLPSMTAMPPRAGLRPTRAHAARTFFFLPVRTVVVTSEPAPRLTPFLPALPVLSSKRRALWGAGGWVGR